MASWVVIFDLSARYFYEHIATTREQVEISEIVNWISLHPYVDDEVKFAFTYPPFTGALYADGRYWIVYEINDERTITVLNIGFEEEVPSPAREEDYP